MTPDRDIERLLDGWLSEGPTQVSDRVFDDLASRIARASQRPAWRLRSWRLPTMSTSLKIVLLGAALVILALGGATLIGGGKPVVVAPTITPTASTPSSSPAGSPALASQAAFDVDGPCGGPTSTCRGVLAAGTYTSRAFQPQLTYTVPAGWLNKFDQGGGYGLAPDTAENQTSVSRGDGWVTSLELQRNLAFARRDCTEAAEPGVATNATSIVEALAGDHAFTITTPAPVAIGGLTGTSVDLRIASGATLACGDSEPLLIDANVEPGSGLHWGAVEDERYRLIVLDTPDRGTVTISVFAAHAAGWDAYVGQAQSVIDSFEFRLGG